MLKKEVIKANAILATLTDEQIAAIEKLSENDENAVIGKKTGEIHGSYEQDILTLTGIKKNDGEKAYDYMKRVLGDYKTQSESFESQKSELKSTIDTLKAKIEAGEGNEVIKQQLKDAQQQLKDVENTYKTQVGDLQSKYNDLQGKYNMSIVDTEFVKALNGVKFKSEYPENVINVMISNAKNSILAENKPEFVDENGKQSLIFRDKDGNILKNPANQLQPYSAKEMLLSNLKDIIDHGREQRGNGSKGGKGGKGGTVDISGAKTQVEADEIIANHLMASGFTRDSEDFSAKLGEIRSELEVSNLPIQ